MRGLDSGRIDETITIPRLEEAPIVVESNTLSATIVPFNTVQVPDPKNKGTFLPRLLWPTRTYFPTFD